VLIFLVGPAGLTALKEIKDLRCGETIGIPNVSLCLSQRTVSLAPKKKSDFEPLEHSVYRGRRRLGRYARVAPKRYAAYDADDRPLGEFKRRKKAYAAVGRNSERGAQ
jgi:hypothetical protein